MGTLRQSGRGMKSSRCPGRAQNNAPVFFPSLLHSLTTPIPAVARNPRKALVCGWALPCGSHSSGPMAAFRGGCRVGPPQGLPAHLPCSGHHPYSSSCSPHHPHWTWLEDLCPPASSTKVPLPIPEHTTYPTGAFQIG